MRLARTTPRTVTPALMLGLAFAFTIYPRPACSQPPSTGSGAGTGTGLESGPGNATGTGMESGAGNMTGTGAESGALSPVGGPIGSFGTGGVAGDATLPNTNYAPVGMSVNPEDAGSIPLSSLIPGGSVAGTATISDKQLSYARRLRVPSDRSLALSRIASAATFSNQLDLSDRALADASQAAMLIPDGIIRDQRLISIIFALMYLSEAQLREGRTDVPVGSSAGPAPAGEPDPDAPTPPAMPKLDRNVMIRRAASDWARAADLAQRISNPTYKNELMFRVADSMAYGSQTIINEFPKAEGGTVKAALGVNRSYGGLPDQLLLTAAKLATRIERPVWHDRALVAVAVAAAESKQFARALDIARMIPQPEVRSDALLKVSELQARRGDVAGATKSYRETASAVAAIPLNDLRSVLAGVLIDSLISVGRFEDARRSIVLYPDQPHQMLALESVAESQGRRGSANAALEWIQREVPEQYRSLLYRKVNNGLVAAIESNRSRDLSGGGKDR